MKPFALLLALLTAFPVCAQEKRAKKPAAHAKPTPQQIRKFKELEKKQEKRRARRPGSGEPPAKAIRAPSPK